MMTDVLSQAGQGRLRFTVSDELARQLAAEQPDEDRIAQLLQILFNLHELTREPHCRSDVLASPEQLS